MHTRVVKSNGKGLCSAPALLLSSDTIQVTATGFEPRNLTGLVVHAGDESPVPTFTLAIGSETQNVTVEADGEMIPQDNGARSDILSSKDIENLALKGRDTTELLKVLPGASTQSGGLTQSNPVSNDLSISAKQSASKAIALNTNPNGGKVKNFGFMDTRTAYPCARIFEFNVKYSF